MAESGKQARHFPRRGPAGPGEHRQPGEHVARRTDSHRPAPVLRDVAQRQVVRAELAGGRTRSDQILLAPEGVERNRFSEADFKMLKCCGAFPESFNSPAHAGEWRESFIAYYDHEPRHAGSGPPISASVCFGAADPVSEHRRPRCTPASPADPSRLRYPSGSGWMNQNEKQNPPDTTHGPEPSCPRPRSPRPPHCSADRIVGTGPACATRLGASNVANIPVGLLQGSTYVALIAMDGRTKSSYPSPQALLRQYGQPGPHVVDRSRAPPLAVSVLTWPVILSEAPRAAERGTWGVPGIDGPATIPPTRQLPAIVSGTQHGGGIITTGNQCVCVGFYSSVPDAINLLPLRSARRGKNSKSSRNRTASSGDPLCRCPIDSAGKVK